MAVHQMTTTIIVGREADEVYQSWADIERLPELMPHLRRVQATAEGRTRWVAAAPLGGTVEWDAEITRVDPNKRIAWRSTRSGDIRTSGQVTFNALPDQQTEVTVVLQYAASPLRDAAARAWTRQALEEDLRSFKAHLEGRARNGEGSTGDEPRPALG
jgi:uncharacterized membrane protein